VTTPVPAPHQLVERRRLAEVADSISTAASVAEFQTLLHAGTLALGAERSYFASVSGDGANSACVVILDCDPAWWHRYRAGSSLHDDPWLGYALRHAAPVLTSELKPNARQNALFAQAAAAAGFASGLVVPAHSGTLEQRFSVFCLGHSTPGFFDAPTFDAVRVGARSIANEMHEWWARNERERLTQSTRLSAQDLELLERHCAGLSSKQIAAELNVSCDAVNSRFQRIIVRLGVRTRRAAATVAVKCGLLVL